MFDDDASEKIPAPDLSYRPNDPNEYDPNIAIIGCGNISKWHLRAYERAGYRVAAMCDLTRSKAERRRDEFYPEADVYTESADIFERADVDVVDIATRPNPRESLIERALRADKHVLSQKPFVTDLRVAENLVDLAERRGLKLAVNQNGRWAPQFSYIRHAVDAGLIGDVTTAHLSEHWDHDREDDPEFEAMKHAVLYDFAVHWFDLVSCLLDDPLRVHASAAYSPTQKTVPPLFAQVLVEYDDAQVSLVFDGDTSFGTQERTYVTGTDGTIESVGPNWQEQSITLYTDEGYAEPELEGEWFPVGFHGAMAELLSSIEADREPVNDARSVISTMELCFAAMASADRNEPVVPGDVRELPRYPDWPPS